MGLSERHIMRDHVFLFYFSNSFFRRSHRIMKQSNRRPLYSTGGPRGPRPTPPQERGIGGQATGFAVNGGSNRYQQNMGYKSNHYGDILFDIAGEGAMSVTHPNNR